MAPNHVYRVEDAKALSTGIEYFVHWGHTWETAAEITRYGNRKQHILSQRVNSKNVIEYNVNWIPSWIPKDSQNFKRQITDYYMRQFSHQKTTEPSVLYPSFEKLYTSTRRQKQLEQATALYQRATPKGSRATIPRISPSPPSQTYVKPPSLETSEIRASTSGESASQIHTTTAVTPSFNTYVPVSEKMVIIDYENTSDGIFYKVKCNKHHFNTVTSVKATNLCPLKVIQLWENKYAK